MNFVTSWRTQIFKKLVIIYKNFYIKIIQISPQPAVVIVPESHLNQFPSLDNLFFNLYIIVENEKVSIHQ